MAGPLFDETRILAHYTRAAKHFGDADFLFARVWEEMRDKRADIVRELPMALVRAPLRPAILDEDLAHAGLWAWKGKPDQLADLVYSLLEMHLVEDLPGLLQCIRASLHPDGVMLASLFGEDTLTELRHSLLQAEADVTGGAAARVIPMLEVQTLGSLLQAAGFALPVVDVSRVVVRYESLTALLHDLRAMGQTAPMAGRVSPLRRSVLTRAEEIYRERHGDVDGRLPASFTVLHACGWAPHPDQQKPLKPGSGQMFLGDALKKPQA